MAQVKPQRAVGTNFDEENFKDTFTKACSELWETSVRADLIYDRKLMCCEECLGMFYLDEERNDHPEDKCFRVSVLCSEKGITSSEQLAKALWYESLALYSKFGMLVFPRMSMQHEEPPQTQQPSKDMQASWTMARVAMLERDVLILQADNANLLADKKALEKEVKLLVERLLKEKALIQKIKLTADRHIDALHCLLHSEGCGCTGECHQAPPLQA